MTKLIEEVFGKETFEGVCAVLDERDALREQVESLQKENAGLYARVNDLEWKARKAENRRRDVLKYMKRYKRELDKAREELEGVKNDRDALRAVLESRQVRGCVLAGNRTCEDLEWTESRLASAEKELERVQGERDALEEEAQNLYNALKEAEEAKDRAEQDASDYLAQLIGLQEDKEEAQERRKESALAVEDLEEEYQALRTAFLELQRQLKEALKREDDWKALWEAAAQVLNSGQK